MAASGTAVDASAAGAATGLDAAAPDVAPDAADATSFARLVGAIRAEIAALESEDAARIEAATAAKVSALARVEADIAAGTPADRALLEAARDLNAEAALRARGKQIAVERRLQLVSAAAGRPAPLVYGRNGRWA
jgi:hypothetical protein